MNAEVRRSPDGELAVRVDETTWQGLTGVWQDETMGEDEVRDWVQLVPRPDAPYQLPITTRTEVHQPGRPRRPVLSPMHAALLAHHPIMRSETGPLSGCRCGGVGLGQDVISHVIEQLRSVQAPALAELRALVDTLEGKP